MRRAIAILLLSLLSLPAFGQGRTMGRAQPALTLQYVLQMGGTWTGTGADTALSLTHTPAAAFSGDLVHLEGVGPNFNGSLLNLKSDDANAYLITGHDGSGDVFTVSQSGDGDFSGDVSASDINAGTYLTVSSTDGFLRVADDGLHMYANPNDGAANNHIIFASYVYRAKDFDHDTASTGTETFWQSDENPDVSNQEWGSITHDGGDLTISTGDATGVGSAPTTIRNAVKIAANLVTTEQTGGDNQASTLGVGAATVAITTDFLTLTGDGGGNTVGTITGGITGQVLRILFVDANVTITDTDAHTANTVDLAGAATDLTSADDMVLTLLYDGTSWYEAARISN